MTIAELQEDRVVEAVYAVKAKRKLRTAITRISPESTSRWLGDIAA